MDLNKDATTFNFQFNFLVVKTLRMDYTEHNILQNIHHHLRKEHQIL